MIFSWTPYGGTETQFVEPTYTLLADWDMGGIRVNHLMYEAPYLDGKVFIDSLLSDRTAGFKILLQASSRQTLFDLQKSINALFNPKLGIGKFSWTQEDSTKYSLDCKIANGYPKFPSGRNRSDVWQVCEIQLVAADSTFYKEPVNSLNLVSYSGGFTLPLSTPMTFGLISSTTVVNNQGHVDTPVYIIFHGDMTNPRVDNLTSGKYIAATMTLNAGELLEVNTKAGSHTMYKNVGGTRTNAFQYLNSGSEFFILTPGNNNLQFSSSTAGAAAYCEIFYYNRFVGL